MIGNVINKERYTILSTTPSVSGYSIPFKYWDKSHISVVLTSSAGVETTVDSASYAVTSPADSGTITFVAGYTFPEGTALLTVVRTVTIEQQTDLRNGDVLDADTLERMFDTNVAILQELNEKLDRTVRIPVSDPSLILQMPSSLIRANMLLGFDASGNIIPILTSEIEQNLADALAAETSVDGMYNDAGMVAVRTDMALGASSKILAVANNKTNIDTVSTAITNVNSVGTNITNVNAAASNATNINAAVANSSNINAVVSNATNINIVAGDKANIDAVAANKPNIDAVAANEADINAVNTNKTNIDTVATDLALGASSNVKKVADAIANVNAVGTDIAKVNAVQAKLTEVDNVSDNMTAVVNTHTNMAAIIASPTQAANAATAKTAAESARDKARKWSEEIEDTPVDTGEYSAKHHALKAAASAASAHLADAAANKQLTIDGTLYQYVIQQASISGHLKISFVEVV